MESEVPSFGLERAGLAWKTAEAEKRDRAMVVASIAAPIEREKVAETERSLGF